jgi:hypothetical protein
VTGAQATSWRYLAVFAAVVVVLAGLCLTANMLIDPLWYFRGNRVTGVNYAFNERVAKLNQLLPRLTDYDCVMFGSSTTTLVPPPAITGRRCFNLGFSGGVVSEFLVYAKYLRARGFAPKVLIVGVDGFDFEGPTLKLSAPDFVKAGDDPPPAWKTYLSVDAFVFSFRTVFELFPNRRRYDRDFRCHIIARKTPYVMPATLAPQLLAQRAELHPERAELYAELRRLFPEARALAFVAPHAAWNIAQLQLDGTLEAYLEGLRRTAAAFDSFLDFSIPSEITVSTTNTYDGVHFADAVNDHTSAALAAGDPTPGLDWKRESDAAITAAYADRIDRVITKKLLAARP